MTSQHLSAIWAAIARPMANHLWQSTAFAAVVWLLALALRGNQARTRYWLWMIASAKFLIPFSLLIAAGGYLRPHAAAPIATPVVSAVMEQMTQPFSQTLSLTDIAPTSAAPSAAAHGGGLLPMILLSVWACGSLIVTFSWWSRWRTIHAAVREASYMTSIANMPVLSSPSLLEPGAFGIFRPVLLLPEGIRDRLTTAQLSAILAHEICHVRRRDNLTAAIHMMVEAAFWFHPATWWIRARLVEERERACDEAVLQSGSEALVYAEGILNVCKFYVESPLACVSGVTGSDLKKRIVRIMSEQVARKLDFSRKLLLSAAGLLAVAAPVVFGVVHATVSRAQSQDETATAAKSDPLEGIWQGTLQAERDLRTVIKISKTDGRLKAAFYYVDQGGQPIPVTSITLQGSAVNFSIKALDLTYLGTLNPDGNSIAGSATTMNGQTHALNLERVTEESAWPIPEPPKPMAADADPSFDVATIKPSSSGAPSMQGLHLVGRNFGTRNASLADLISFAYDVQAKQVVAAPEWIDKDRYDIAAVPEQEGSPNVQQLKIMIRKLLADRFKLTFHHDKRELSAFVLTVGKSGPKLTPTELSGPLPGMGFVPGKGGLMLVVRNGTMTDFTGLLQTLVLDRPVVDQTGITGRFDFSFTFTPDDSEFNGHPPPMPMPMPKQADEADAAPGFFEAIQQQVGLKLDAKKAPVNVLVVDHVEKPSAN
jgi:uncharacterized protein (TIGR03435 family)